MKVGEQETAELDEADLGLHVGILGQQRQHLLHHVVVSHRQARHCEQQYTDIRNYHAKIGK